MAESKQFNIVRRITTRAGRVMWLPVGTFTLNDDGRGVATLNASEGEFFVFPSRFNAKGEHDQSAPEPVDREATTREHPPAGGARPYSDRFKQRSVEELLNDDEGRTPKKGGYKFDPEF